MLRRVHHFAPFLPTMTHIVKKFSDLNFLHRVLTSYSQRVTHAMWKGAENRSESGFPLPRPKLPA
jgi:hypothetical protein